MRALALPEAPGERGGGQAFGAALAGRGRRGRRWRRRSWPGRGRRGCRRPRRRGRRRRGRSPAVSSCRCQAASALGAKTRSQLLGGRATRPTPSSRAPAEWITAPRGCSCGDRGEQRLELARGRRRRRRRSSTSAPSSSSSAAQLARRPPPRGPQRLARSRWRAPWLLGEVAGDEGAEAAGGAGDQDGALGVEGSRLLLALRLRHGNRPRRQRHALAQGELGLLASLARAAAQRLLRRPRCRRVSIRAKRPGCSDWAERTRPQTAAGGGVGGLLGAGGDRAAGEDRQARVGLGLVGEPAPGSPPGRSGRPRGPPRRVGSSPADSQRKSSTSAGALVPLGEGDLASTRARAARSAPGPAPCSCAGSSGRSASEPTVASGGARAVGERERDLALAPGASRTRSAVAPLGLQRDPAPGEGQPQLRRLLGRRRGAMRVQGGVEQGRVEAEALGLAAPAPRAARPRRRSPRRRARRRCRPWKAGPYSRPSVGEAVVEVVDLERLGAWRGPGGEGLGRDRSLGGESARGVAGPLPRPLVLAALRAGVDRDLGARRPRPGSPTETCSCDRALLGQDQRGLQGQLLDRLGADLLGGPQGQLEEGGAGQEDGAGDGVVGQPGVGGEGEAAGQGEAARRRGPRSTAPSSGCSASRRPAAARSAAPAASARASSACAGRDRWAAAPRLAPVPAKKASQSSLAPAAWAWARASGERLGARRGPRAGWERRPALGSCLLQALAAPSRTSTGSGPSSRKVAGALRGEGGDGVGEAHRLADVGDPVGGVGGLLGAEQLAGEVGDDRDLGRAVGRGSRRPRRTPPASAPSAASGRRGRRRGAWSCGPAPASGTRTASTASACAGDDDRGRAVDRGERELCLFARDRLGGLAPRWPRSPTIAPPAGSAPISVPRAATSLAASGEGEDAGDVGGGDLADRVAGEEVGLEAALGRAAAKRATSMAKRAGWA